MVLTLSRTIGAAFGSSVIVASSSPVVSASGARRGHFAKDSNIFTLEVAARIQHNALLRYASESLAFYLQEHCNGCFEITGCQC